MNRLHGRLPQRLGHDLSHLRSLQRLRIAGDKRAAAPLDLQDILLAKLVIYLQTRVLVNRLLLGQLPHAGHLLALFQNAGGNLILDLIDDLAINRHGRGWRNPNKNNRHSCSLP